MRPSSAPPWSIRLGTLAAVLLLPDVLARVAPLSAAPPLRGLALTGGLAGLALAVAALRGANAARRGLVCAGWLALPWVGWPAVAVSLPLLLPDAVRHTSPERRWEAGDYRIRLR